METKEFLKMCQKISMLKNDSKGIKVKIPNELFVKVDKTIYYPLEYKMSFSQGKPRNIGILHDLNANSIIETNLEKIERC